MNKRRIIKSLFILHLLEVIALSSVTIMLSSQSHSVSGKDDFIEAIWWTLGIFPFAAWAFLEKPILVRLISGYVTALVYGIGAIHMSLYYSISSANLCVGMFLFAMCIIFISVCVKESRKSE